MNHEMHDPAFIDPAQLVRLHLQIGDIVRQEMASCRLKRSEDTGQSKTQSAECDQRTSVANQRLKQALVIALHVSVLRRRLVGSDKTGTRILE